MKNYNIFFLIIFLLFTLQSCEQVSLYDNYDGREDTEEAPNPNNPGPSEGEKPIPSTIRDLVLISSNLQQYNHPWDEEDWNPYVVWENNGKKEWLFDGFLLGDSHDNEGNSFMMGHGSTAALKIHWEKWVNMIFTNDRFVSSLNSSISKYSTSMGQPSRKRKIIVSIPEPLTQAAEWGEVGGKMLNMMKDEDRLVAVKWFIDLVTEKFKQGNYANVELEGFYWVAEELAYTKTILPEVAKYLRDKKFTFLWIPWWNSPGYNDSGKHGFSDVYLQPNYFWNNVEYSRLQDAVNKAIQYDLHLEVECDESVYKGNGQRLYDYLEVFKQNDIHKIKKLAYYQSINVFGTLGVSTNASDKELYNTLCEMVVERQKEADPKYIEK